MYLHDALCWISDIRVCFSLCILRASDIFFSLATSADFSLRCASWISLDKLSSSWHAQLFWLDPLWLTWKLPNPLVRLDVLRLSYGRLFLIPPDAGIFLSLQRSLDETDLLGVLMMVDIDISLLVLVHTSTISTKLNVIISHQFKCMCHWCKDQT